MEKATMGATTMGRVVVKAKIENLTDLLKVSEGSLRSEEVRSIECDAVVDTGAKLLSLPKRFIDKLGLEYFATRQAQTAVGYVPCRIYRAVWLSIEGRKCTVDVAQVSDDAPILIGYVPLELLDFVVDPVKQQLVPNPEHGGQQVLDLL
ncbi:MAG TPA: aspartyl protease family protein [Gemmataceae bacterium]|jgi:predicted aspartyl protease|nr:aspartyl protease family protein [Gemmataceae bacterium]